MLRAKNPNARRNKGRRFRVERLEERIAPAKKGWTNPKNPHYVPLYSYETCAY